MVSFDVVADDGKHCVHGDGDDVGKNCIDGDDDDHDGKHGVGIDGKHGVDGDSDADVDDDDDGSKRGIDGAWC